MLRTIAVARLLMPEVNIQAPPNLSAPYYEDLLDAGINDWGGISPLTPDFINPEKPWPHLEQLKLRTEAKGYISAPTSAGLSGVLAGCRPLGLGLLAERVRAAADPQGFARRSGMIVVLTGGTGGAKVRGRLAAESLAAEELTFIVNTGDDLRVVGLCTSRPTWTRSPTLSPACSAGSAAGA